MNPVRDSPDAEAPVVLLDDEDWEDADRDEVAVTRPRRWKEAALAALVVAVVVGIGATSSGEGDAGRDETSMPTTTTSARPTTTTRPPSTAPTTTWPETVTGSGPILGTDRTGSAVVIIENRGRVASLDLDTGDLCRFDANGTWLTWPMPSGPRAMLQGDDGPTLVDASCAITSVDWSGWIAATTASSVWTMNDGPTSLLQEWSLDGTPTGRELRVPANATTIVGDGEWIVVGAAGEMTAVRGDERRSLGVGFPLAAGGGRVVVVRCPALECSVAIVDIRTGRSQAIDIEAPLSWEPPVMSPDGRWLHFSTAVGRTGQQIESRLVDLETLAERPFPGGLVAFTADSRWLVSARSSVVEARSLLDDRVVDLTEMFDGPVQGLVAIDR